MSRAIGSFVVGAGLMAIIVARRSQIAPIATYVQEGPAIMMAAVAADFIAREGAQVADVFVLLVVTMVTTAVVTALLGHFGLSGLGRSMPTSVIGAFVGGTGWLLFKAGLDITVNATVGLSDLRELFGSETAQFWVPGVAIGVLAWLTNRSTRVPGYAFGLILAVGLAGFYVVVALASSISAVQSGGWLLGPFPEAGITRLVFTQ